MNGTSNNFRGHLISINRYYIWEIYSISIWIRHVDISRDFLGDKMIIFI
jgi:hypothetical protein